MDKNDEEWVSIPARLDHAWKVGLGQRLDKQDSVLESQNQILSRLLQRQDTQDDKLEKLTEASKAANSFFASAKGAMAFFDFMNKLIKPFFAIGAAAATIWLAIKGK